MRNKVKISGFTKYQECWKAVILCSEIVMANNKKYESIGDILILIFISSNIKLKKKDSYF